MATSRNRIGNIRYNDYGFALSAAKRMKKPKFARTAPKEKSQKAGLVGILLYEKRGPNEGKTVL